VRQEINLNLNNSAPFASALRSLRLKKLKLTPMANWRMGEDILIHFN